MTARDVFWLFLVVTFGFHGSAFTILALKRHKHYYVFLTGGVIVTIGAY
jgi:hypothetical protein